MRPANISRLTSYYTRPWLISMLFCRKGKKNDKKPVIEEKKPYLEAEVCQQPSVAIDLSKIIHKPADVDTKEWVATHSKLYLSIA